MQNLTNTIKLHRNWLLIVIAVISFFLRLGAIQHELPYQMIEDEGSDLTTSVRLIVGELPQRHVRYHRSLIAYNNLIPILGVAVINFIDGDVRSASDFEDLYFSNRAEFTYATRLWMAFLTSSAIFFIGLAGTYIDPKIGILSSIILALNGFFFHTSLYALPDALGASMTGLTIWLIMRVWRYRRTRDYIFMSLGLALVMLSKLNAASIGFGFLVAHGFIIYDKIGGNWKRFLWVYVTDRNFWIAALAGILGNIIFNPLAFLYPSDFLYEIQRLQQVVYGQQALTLSQRISYGFEEMTRLLFIIWRWAFPLVIVAMWQIWRKRKQAPYIIALVMFIALFSITFSSRYGPISHFYYWNSWIVPMALVAAIGLGAFIDFFQATKWKFIAWVIIVVFVILEGIFFLRIWTLMTTPSTQEQARAYVIQNIPAQSRILASDPLIVGVPLYRTSESIERAIDLKGSILSQWQWWLEQPISELPTSTYDIYSSEFGALVNSFDDIESIIESNRIEYVIVADYCDNAHNNPATASALAFPPISDDMIASWEVLAEFSPFIDMTCEAYIHYRTKLTFSGSLFLQTTLGPYVTIYRIP